MIFGYARVSTSQQDHALQLDALKAAGVDEVITDTMTGTKTDRPGLDRLLDKAREGDTVVVWRLDRLARSMTNLLALVDTLQRRGVHLRSLHEEINTSTANGRLLLQFFGMMAEFEASLLKERTIAGLAAAKEQGRVGGRPRVMSDEQIAMASSLIAAGHNKTNVAKQLGVSRATLYRNLGDS